MKVAKKTTRNSSKLGAHITKTAKEVMESSSFRMFISERCEIGVSIISGKTTCLTYKRDIKLKKGIREEKETQTEYELVIWMKMLSPVRTFRVIECFPESTFHGRSSHKEAGYRSNPIYKKLKAIIRRECSDEEKRKSILRYFVRTELPKSGRSMYYNTRSQEFIAFLFLKSRDEASPLLLSRLIPEHLDFFKMINHPILQKAEDETFLKLLIKLKI